MWWCGGTVVRDDIAIRTTSRVEFMRFVIGFKKSAFSFGSIDVNTKAIVENPVTLRTKELNI
jgi:hypothetical protein